ncbi:hypothetical protein [Streptomyces sp. B21-101]|uniref:hypothetical protein n=1 Tax=Streptomyces sp. B21-101 TaxID=3039415 RepID=UPI002FF29E6D
MCEKPSLPDSTVFEGDRHCPAVISLEKLPRPLLAYGLPADSVLLPESLPAAPRPADFSPSWAWDAVT